MLVSVADIHEIVEDEGPPQGGGEEGAGGSARGDTGAASQPLQAILPPPLTQPPNTALRINDIRHTPIVPIVKEVGDALEERRKNLASVEYRIKKLDSSIPKIHTALAQQHDHAGAVVSGFINQSQSTITVIKEILQKVENNNDTINKNIDFIENVEELSDFNPKDYSQDINFIRQTSDYKVEAINHKFYERKFAFNNAKTSLSRNKAKLEKEASQNSSR